MRRKTIFYKTKYQRTHCQQCSVCVFFSFFFFVSDELFLSYSISFVWGVNLLGVNLTFSIFSFIIFSGKFFLLQGAPCIIMCSTNDSFQSSWTSIGIANIDFFEGHIIAVHLDFPCFTSISIHMTSND